MGARETKETAKHKQGPPPSSKPGEEGKEMGPHALRTDHTHTHTHTHTRKGLVSRGQVAKTFQRAVTPGSVMTS